jgi:hypothetical protein
MKLGLKVLVKNDEGFVDVILVYSSSGILELLCVLI